MLPDRVSNPGPLTYESGALPIALPGQAYEISPENNSGYLDQTAWFNGTVCKEFFTQH